MKYIDDNLNKLLDSGEKIDRGELTKAGRGLQKHGDRENSVFPKATGNEASKNAQGQLILMEILTSKNITSKFNESYGYDIFDKNTRRGVRFDTSDSMVGFVML